MTCCWVMAIWSFSHSGWRMDTGYRDRMWFYILSNAAKQCIGQTKISAYLSIYWLLGLCLSEDCVDLSFIFCFPLFQLFVAQVSTDNKNVFTVNLSFVHVCTCNQNVAGNWNCLFATMLTLICRTCRMPLWGLCILHSTPCPEKNGPPKQNALKWTIYNTIQ